MKKLLALSAALPALALAGAVAIAQDASPFADSSATFAQLNKDTGGIVQQQVMHAAAGDVMAAYIVRTALAMYSKQDEIVIVLSGHGSATVGYPSYQLQPGSFVSIPRNTAFQIISTGKAPIKAYIIASPSDNPNDRRVLQP